VWEHEAKHEIMIFRRLEDTTFLVAKALQRVETRYSPRTVFTLIYAHGRNPTTFLSDYQREAVRL